MDANPRLLVVPTDFSEAADRALSRAVDMARALRARIDLIHVYSPILILPPPIDLIALPTVLPDAIRKMEEALETRAARVREAQIACEVALIEGVSYAEIVRHAEKAGAELIVMGTHGRSGVAHVILGSVAERVLHRATCPVLVVPDRARSSGG